MTSRRSSADERRARLARRHRLNGDAADGVDVTRSVVALHSTDAATVFLSTWARTPGLRPADLEEALYDDRSLVRVLGMRRTLFVVPRDLVPAIYAGCARTIAARERRRLEQLIEASGISKRPAVWLKRACADALAALEDRGEAFTSDLAGEVPRLGKKLRLGIGTRFEITQTVAARVVRQLAMEGDVIRGRPRGNWTSGQYRWVPTASWLGGPVEPMDPAKARVELLGRWLAAFGPATELDMRWWTGWTAAETRAALAALPHALVELDEGPGFVLESDLDLVKPPPPTAALLPTLDPTTMGWKERGWYLGRHGASLFDSNGNAGPTVWWGGRVVGAWAQRADGEIVVRLLEDVGREAETAVERKAAALAEWLGEVRVKPGFLPPFQRALAAEL